MFKITLKNGNTIESLKINQFNVRGHRAKLLLFNNDLDDEILANEKKIINKVILNNNKYVFLCDIHITDYTVTGIDRHILTSISNQTYTTVKTLKFESKQ